jgi:hypothetical protein
LSRPRLPLPPSVDELADLARLLGVEAPALLPAFVWCVCRSSRAVRAYRTSRRPSGAHLAMLQSYPTAARLISASHDGAEWLRKWTQTGAALDDLLPRIVVHGVPDKGDGDDAS